jgi:hypothetical protein
MSQFNEIFSKYVTEKLYEGNAFLTYTKNVSEYANGKIVHIPQFTFTGTVAVDGSNFTGTTAFDVDRPFETDLTFTTNEYHFTQPIMVSDFDEAMTSYNKMDVTFGDATNTLADSIAKRILNKIAKDVPTANKLRTTGSAGTANNPKKDAARKKITYVDILSIAQAFDEANLPEQGRYLLLDPVMYNELLQDSQIINALNFGEATLPTGVVREVAGINIMKKNTISNANSSGAVKTLGDSIVTGDHRIGIAWHQDCIVRADSGVKTYQSSNDPYKRGSVFNASYYMGCVNPRKDVDDKGVYLIIQAS